MELQQNKDKAVQTQKIDFGDEVVNELVERSKKPIDIKTLNKMAEDSDSDYKNIISEMQTNVLIYAGEQYAKVVDNFKRVLNRDETVAGNNKTQLRLTMNHTQSVCNEYINNLLTYAPGTLVKPVEGGNIQQETNAKECNSVKKFVDKQIDFTMLRNFFASDYTIVGEVCRYTYFDPTKGQIKGYENKPETEGLVREWQEQIVTEMGTIETITKQEDIEPEKDLNKPIRTGSIVTEKLNPYDVFLEKGVEAVEQSRFIGVKKLRNKYEMINKIAMSELPQEEKVKRIKWFSSENKETFTTFDKNSKSRSDNEDLFLVRYFFFKPCPEFPRGRIFETVKEGIVTEYNLQEDNTGEPYFPIHIMPCIYVSGSARGVSIIRQGRVLQAEINRTMSKTAEHQIMLGDDKIITTGKDGLTEGAKLGGIRHFSLDKGYQGFQVIQGRSGEQFVPYLELLIRQFYFMYKLESNDTAINNKQGADLTVMLLRSMSQKKHFVQFAQKFEKFLCDMTRDHIKLAKRYLDEETVIMMIGNNEAINVSEFKTKNDLDYEISIEAVNSDAETQMAAYLSFEKIMQYAGGKLDNATLGKVLSNMPFIPDAKTIMSNLTVNEQRATDIVLALDRGQYPPVQRYENNDVILRVLSDRMLKGDFITLVAKNPQIKFNYEKQIQEREVFKKQEMEAIRQANQGDVPMGGELVRIQLWETKPTADGKGLKTATMTLPYETIAWAKQQYEKQLQMKESLEVLPSAMQADIMSGTNPQIQSQAGQQVPV